jgi:hypothetical protein
MTSNPLAQICSCTWYDGLREPGIDCPVHRVPPPGKDRFRKVESNTPWRLIPCRLCGSPAELWQRWRRDDVWDSFGCCTNIEDVDGEACLFGLPDDPHFYRDRKTDAVRHWNLIMGPRGAHETNGQRTPKDYAIEHGGYLADAAESFIKAVDEHERVVLGFAGEDPDPSIEAPDMEKAEQAECDHRDALKNAIYEFRKRVERAKHSPQEPK